MDTIFYADQPHIQYLSALYAFIIGLRQLWKGFKHITPYSPPPPPQAHRFRGAAALQGRQPLIIVAVSPLDEVCPYHLRSVQALYQPIRKP